MGNRCDKRSEDWERVSDSEVQNTCYACRGTGFSSQPPHSVSKPSIAIPEKLRPSFILCRQQGNTWYTYTQKKFLYTNCEPWNDGRTCGPQRGKGQGTTSSQGCLGCLDELTSELRLKWGEHFRERMLTMWKGTHWALEMEQEL